MLALSIRQPWPWMILHGGKEIENRGWSSEVRGTVLIHAAWRGTPAKFNQACSIVEAINPDISFPEYEQLPRGGIVGSVEIVDCVSHSGSPWFAGPYGFVLRNPKSLPFVACAGGPKFFDVSSEVILALGLGRPLTGV